MAALYVVWMRCLIVIRVGVVLWVGGIAALAVLVLVLVLLL